MKPIRYTKEMTDEFVKDGHWTQETFYDFWKKNANEIPDQEALVDSKYRLTWKEAVDLVDAIAISFVLGYVIKLATRALRVARETSISMVLMGSLKNYGLASGILLTLFGERAAIPASVCTVFGILHLVWLGFRYRKKA